MGVGIYLLAVNGLTFAAFAWDKGAAAAERRRLPEYTLLSLCVLGGSVGGLLGMYLCRHKTRKPLFFVGVPLLLAAQTALGLWLLLGQKGGV